jgi:hypothetical protein
MGAAAFPVSRQGTGPSLRALAVEAKAGRRGWRKRGRGSEAGEEAGRMPTAAWPTGRWNLLRLTRAATAPWPEAARAFPAGDAERVCGSLT